MTFDLSEFHGVFFEECFEGLDVMESGLLNLDHGTDVEDINAIFRAAHSIKGGGASFGFMDISNFTHVLETLLDEMRVGSRAVSRTGVDVLLESVDVLRGMVNAAKDDQENDERCIADAKTKLEAMLANKEEPTSAAKDCITVPANEESAVTQEADVQAEPGTDISGWCIHFTPHAQMLQTGNEPARIFRELSSMGELSVEVNTSDLPSLDDINPKHCYLGWNLDIRGDICEEEIYELFNWVIDECDLSIERVGVANTEEDPKTTSLVVTTPSAADVSSFEDSSIPESTTPETVAQQDTKITSVEGTANKSKGSAPVKEAGGSIRVATDKVDELNNMVGELVITQSMLSQISALLSQKGEVDSDPKLLEKLLAGMAQLERNTRELQESVLKIRMLPISFSFSRFPRLVRDLSSKLGKKIELKMTGEQTEVDKTVLEKIGDPLVHLVRNSLDHGIEVPEVREAAGKPEIGTLELYAYHQGGDIIIEVIDDGAGLDRERILNKAIDKGLVGANEELSDERIYNLIFAPGFSTAEVLSDVSGRGVGLDVVRRNVRDLGGNVSIDSNLGAGTTVTIRLPLTLAILDGQLVRVANETYIVSLVSIVESLQMRPEQISTVTGQSELYNLCNEYIPILRVSSLFGNNFDQDEPQSGLLMVVEADGKRFGLLVDDLLGQQQVVIKSLETNFQQVQGISGATILGDGTVALIIDVPGLIQRHFDNCSQSGQNLHAVA